MFDICAVSTCLLTLESWMSRDASFPVEKANMLRLPLQQWTVRLEVEQIHSGAAVGLRLSGYGSGLREVWSSRPLPPLHRAPPCALQPPQLLDWLAFRYPNSSSCIFTSYVHVALPYAVNSWLASMQFAFELFLCISHLYNMYSCVVPCTLV